MVQQEPSEVAELIGRSNRLGSDRRNTNYAGGNTSAKGTATDPVTGEPVELLWVKGSGGDLGTLTPAGLAVLRLDRLRALTGVYPGVRARGRDGGRVRLLPAWPGRGGGVRASRAWGGGVRASRARAGARPVHRHGHARAGGRAARGPSAPGLGDRVRHRGRRRGADRGVLRRPGRLGALAPPRVPARPGHRRTAPGQPRHDRRRTRRPRDHRVGRDQRRSARRTRWRSSTGAQRYLDEHGAGEPFGSEITGFGPLPAPAAPGPRRGAGAAAARPGQHRPAAGRATTPATPRCWISWPGASTRGWRRSAPPARTTSCAPRSRRWCWTCRRPRRWPRWPTGSASCTPPTGRPTGGTTSGTPRADSPPMRGADPAIVLVPGVGMFSFGADKQTARVAGEFYVNAINVMRGAESVSAYAPIGESEKFRIEYWELEEAKLRRRPRPKAAGGPGRPGHRGRVWHRAGHRAAAGRRGSVRGARRPGRRRGQAGGRGHRDRRRGRGRHRRRHRRGQHRRGVRRGGARVRRGGPGGQQRRPVGVQAAGRHHRGRLGHPARGDGARARSWCPARRPG